MVRFTHPTLPQIRARSFVVLELISTMNRFRIFLAAVCAIALTPIANGNSIKSESGDDLVKFDYRVLPEDPFHAFYQKDKNEKWKPRRGEIVRVELIGTLKDGWNTYPLTQRTSEQQESSLTKWEIEKTSGFTPLWPLRETNPEKRTTIYGKSRSTEFKFYNTFSWSQDIYIAENALPGPAQVSIKLNIQLCEKGCQWYKHAVPVKLEISDEPVIPNPDIKERLNLTKPSITVVQIEAAKSRKKEVGAKGKAESAIMSEGLITDSPEDYKKKMGALAERFTGGAAGDSDSDLLGFLLVGAFFGAISLITPCVFPMIPITVSFFLKQSEKENHQPIVMATVYSLTIVVVLTLAASLMLSIFRLLSIHPITNYVIGGLFIFFALSLFGMYEIELPQSLAQYTSEHEGKGGLVGTIFMALTFTIISFACVAPFLGGFGAAVSNRPFWHNILGGLAFAIPFAAPFFFLALFPSLLRALPKSGSWLNSVKVVMGFLEFAAAFKFFRQAELIHSSANPTFFTFDFVLGIWVALCILCAVYLIGLFRLPHDTPEEHVGVPRLLFGIAFLGLAVYLTPALFKVNSAGQPQRPGGVVYAWIDSFLLPESIEGDDEMPHTGSLEHAIKLALEEAKKADEPAKRIFIDFTGVTCSNCKLNEKNVFTKTNIALRFEEYIVVKMYTDTIPAAYYAKELQSDVGQRAEQDAKGVNLAFQKKVFGTEELPLYVIIEPQRDGKIRIVGRYNKARIDDEADFAKWLENPTVLR